MKHGGLLVKVSMVVLLVTALSFQRVQTRAKVQGPQFSKDDSVMLPAPLKNTSERLLKRSAYITSYNANNKIPNWVAWHLTARWLVGNVKRPGNAFHEDTDVPSPRATNTDYRGTGWSRGHMCPAGDNKWNARAMYESFLFTNMCPQNSKLNSGDWNEIESACRRWAKKYGDIYIVTGPILMTRQHGTIGNHKVIVPEAFFKVVICPAKSKGIGFVCRNAAGNRKKDAYVNSIREVERITHINFFAFLPQKLQDKMENQANINDW